MHAPGYALALIIIPLKSEGLCEWSCKNCMWGANYYMGTGTEAACALGGRGRLGSCAAPAVQCSFGGCFPQLCENRGETACVSTRVACGGKAADWGFACLAAH